MRQLKPKPVRPKCPAYLDRIAKREWRRVVPELDRMGLLSGLDGGVLEAYCTAYATMVEAQGVLNREGMTYTTLTGYERLRPEAEVVFRALAQLKGFIAELGLSPSARQRFAVPSVDDDEDPMEQLLRGERIPFDR